MTDDSNTKVTHKSKVGPLEPKHFENDVEEIGDIGLAQSYGVEFLQKMKDRVKKMVSDNREGVADDFGQFHEEDHPRGQPKNKGQFAEGRWRWPAWSSRPRRPRSSLNRSRSPRVRHRPASSALREQDKPRTPEEQQQEITEVERAGREAEGRDG